MLHKTAYPVLDDVKSVEYVMLNALQSSRAYINEIRLDFIAAANAEIIRTKSLGYHTRQNHTPKIPYRTVQQRHLIHSNIKHVRHREPAAQPHRSTR